MDGLSYGYGDTRGVVTTDNGVKMVKEQISMRRKRQLQCHLA
jgi:hypothetical protein